MYIKIINNYFLIFSLSDEAEATAFDNQSSSLIKLNNGTILYLREVNKFLALVCILREDNFDRQGVIDYNFLCFREAIQQVFELRNKNLQSLAEKQQNAQQIPQPPQQPQALLTPTAASSNVTTINGTLTNTVPGTPKNGPSGESSLKTTNNKIITNTNVIGT